MGQKRLTKLSPIYKELEERLGSNYSRVTLNKAHPKAIPYPHYLNYKKTHTQGVASDLVILFGSDCDKSQRGNSIYQDHSIGFSHAFLDDGTILIRVGVQLKGQPKSVSYSPSLPHELVISAIRESLSTNSTSETIIESIYRALVVGEHPDFKVDVESARELEAKKVDDYLNSPEVANLITNVHASINNLSITTSVALELRESIKKDLESSSEYKAVKELEKQLDEARKLLIEKRREIESKHKGRLNAKETIYQGKEEVTHHAEKLVKRLSCDYKTAPNEIRVAIKSVLTHTLTRAGVATNSPANMSNQYYLNEAGLTDVVRNVTDAVNESMEEK